MQRAKIVGAVVLAGLWGVGLAQAPALAEQQSEETVSVSAELRALYNEDQNDRLDGSYDLAELQDRDNRRRTRVDELLRAGGLRTGSDFFHAAMIYQHGTEPQDYAIASVLATAAGFRGHRLGRWLAAAALDRLLIVSGQPQFFGTQFQVNDDNLWEPGPEHPYLNQAMRRIFELDSRAELQSQADQANRPPPD